MSLSILEAEAVREWSKRPWSSFSNSLTSGGGSLLVPLSLFADMFVGVQLLVVFGWGRNGCVGCVVPFEF